MKMRNGEMEYMMRGQWAREGERMCARVCRVIPIFLDMPPSHHDAPISSPESRKGGYTKIVSPFPEHHSTQPIRIRKMNKSIQREDDKGEEEEREEEKVLFCRGNEEEREGPTHCE